MTTQARTPNEQRIAFLECQLVTMRGALERLGSGQVIADGCPTMLPPKGHDIVADELRDRMDFARAALSSSSDYAGKVVVGMEVIKTLHMNIRSVKSCCRCAVDDLEKSPRCETVGRALGAIHSAFPNLDLAIARLDSLRKADAATDAVHAEGGKT